MGLSLDASQVALVHPWFLKEAMLRTQMKAKEELLGVSGFTLEKFGAVSEEVAIEMAEGALTKTKTDIALAVTG